MKTIGIIGGLGPPSTVKYYEGLIEGAQRAFGGVVAPPILITSVNGEDVRQLRIAGNADAEGAFYAQEARRLQNAGADFILIASNTSHKNAPNITAAIDIPLLHLADATAEAITRRGMKRVALLGTAPTMEEDFYKDRLKAAGLDVVVPDAETRHYISDTIYTELVRNIVTEAASAKFRDIIQRLENDGVEGVILGCTELTLLDLAGCTVPLFDTVKIHVAAALKYAMAE